MLRYVTMHLLAAGLAALLAAGAAAATREELEAQVRAAETGFARSMAERDLAAFGSYIAEDALFFNGDGVLRGRAAVVADWRKFFETPAAPFAWEPTEVAVLESGALAMTSGPVYNANGERVGTFNSVWRRGADGVWQVVLDKGCPPCDCAAARGERAEE